MWQHVLTIFIASALINNFVFSRYLGLCIFFGVTKKMETVDRDELYLYGGHADRRRPELAHL